MYVVNKARKGRMAQTWRRWLHGDYCYHEPLPESAPHQPRNAISLKPQPARRTMRSVNRNR